MRARTGRLSKAPAARLEVNLERPASEQPGCAAPWFSPSQAGKGKGYSKIARIRIVD
jgi:hypothetical protein